MLCKCSGKYIDIYFILKITYKCDFCPQELSSKDKKLKRKERIPLLQASDELRDSLQRAGIYIKANI